MPRLWDPAAGPPSTARDGPRGHDAVLLGPRVHGGRPAHGVRRAQAGRPRARRHQHLRSGAAETWVPGLPKMARALVSHGDQLADGRMVTVAGRDTASKVVHVPRSGRTTSGCSFPARASACRTIRATSWRPNGQAVLWPASAIQSRWLDVGRGDGQGRGQVDSSTGLDAPLAVQPRLRLGGHVRDRARSCTSAAAGTPGGTRPTPSPPRRPPRRRRSTSTRRGAALDEHRLRCTTPGGTSTRPSCPTARCW